MVARERLSVRRTLAGNEVIVSAGDGAHIGTFQTVDQAIAWAIDNGYYAVVIGGCGKGSHAVWTSGCYHGGLIP